MNREALREVTRHALNQAHQDLKAAIRYHRELLECPKKEVVATDIGYLAGKLIEAEDAYRAARCSGCGKTYPNEEPICPVCTCIGCTEMAEEGSEYCYHCNPDNCCVECGKAERGHGPGGYYCHRCGPTTTA